MKKKRKVPLQINKNKQNIKDLLSHFDDLANNEKGITLMKDTLLENISFKFGNLLLL